jgi:hypothetical protein
MFKLAMKHIKEDKEYFGKRRAGFDTPSQIKKELLEESKEKLKVKLHGRLG